MQMGCQLKKPRFFGEIGDTLHVYSCLRGPHLVKIAGLGGNICSHWHRRRQLLSLSGGRKGANMKFFRLTLILCGSALVFLPGQSGAAGLVPASDLTLHQAVYDLRLDEDSQGGGPDVMGRIVYELGATCDDYLMNQRIVTRSPVGGDRAPTTDTRAIMLEARDGLRFRFNLQTYQSQKLTKEFVGRAKLTAKGSAGQAEYRKPKALQHELPAGVAFPVTMSRILLAAARSGEKHTEVVVFDGSEIGVFRVVVFIGARQQPDEAIAKTFPIFRGQPWWQMRAAYYPFDDNAALPVFEFGSRLYNNGAASHIVLDYGVIKLNGRLSSATVAPQPECG